MQTKIEAVQEMNTKYARQVRDLKRQTTELLAYFAYAPVDDKLQLAVKEEEEYKYRRLTAASSVVLLT